MRLGTIRVEITTADPIDFIYKITKYNLIITDVILVDALKFNLTVKAKDMGIINEIAGKEGAKIVVIKKLSIISMLTDSVKRPIILVCVLLWLFLLLYLPGKVLFVQVVGNKSVETSTIHEVAEACGVTFGASRRELRSERVKNALLSRIPQLQWAGVNTYGCLAVITVEERVMPIESGNDYPSVGNIIATRDGVISSIVTTKGTPLCRPGQAVIKGQLLVSGYTDGVAAIRAEIPAAEVYAITERIQSSCFMLKSQTRGEIIDVYTEYGIQIGKNVVELSRKCMTSENCCAKIYETEVLTLPGGFCLPIALIKVKSYLYIESAEMSLFEDNDIKRLSDLYLENQMRAGRILFSDHQTKIINDICKIDSAYICDEMIGKLRKEEIMK